MDIEIKVLDEISDETLEAIKEIVKDIKKNGTNNLSLEDYERYKKEKELRYCINGEIEIIIK